MSEPGIRMTDVWPLIAINGDVAGAYRTLMKNGRIRMKDVYVSKKSNLAVIEYFSTEDKERTHRALAGLAAGQSVES